MDKKYDHIYEILTKEKQRVNWDALIDHNKRLAVFLVDSELDLTDVATKIALDDVDPIQEWMKKDFLRKPTGDEVIEFDNDNNIEFDFIIVQPYVLVQEFVDL